MIRLDAVSKRYDDAPQPAVREVSLAVDAGEFLVLLGESGCGKTTTLKMINRLIEPSGGVIRVDGADVSDVDAVELRRRIGYVFQGIGLFPHMTVAENVSIVPRLMQWKRRRIHQRVDELLGLVGLDPPTHRDRFPAQLSGGQQQRVGVARALAAEPKVMLLDEPFGALDPLTRDELQREFALLQRDLGLTAVMVTHDMVEALLLADQIAVMKEGRIVGTGTPRELMHDPHDPYIARIMEMPRRQAERVDALLDREPTLP